MATSNQDGPDPAGAQTAVEFMQLLREARSQSGLAFVEIAQKARQKGYDLSSAAVAEALKRSELPEWQIVTGVLAACGYQGMQIDRWMRVYHDLAAPAQPVAAVPVAAAAATSVQEPLDVEPVSVPPLVLTTTPDKPSRLGVKHFAFAAAVLAALIVVPLMLFGLFDTEPDTVAGEPTGAAPRTSQAAPSPTDLPVVQPSPTEVVAPSTPAPVTTTVKPPTRTTAAPAPPPPPPPPADPGVLRSGVVALTGNQGFDLDTGQSEGVRDFYRWSNDTLARMNGSQLADVSGTPTKQACASLSNRDWDNWVDNLTTGEWLCVYTSERRLARLNITAIGSTLKVSYLVWT